MQAPWLDRYSTGARFDGWLGTTTVVRSEKSGKAIAFPDQADYEASLACHLPADLASSFAPSQTCASIRQKILSETISTLSGNASDLVQKRLQDSTESAASITSASSARTHRSKENANLGAKLRRQELNY